MQPTVNPDRGEPHPRPRMLGACAVAGCLGLAGLAAVGVLIYVAVLLFTHLADEGAPDSGAGKGGRGPRPGPVAPTQLAKDRETIDPGGEFDAVCRAAGGRYLVLRIPSKKQLAVFDPNAAALVKQLDVDENVLFAGTAA